MRIIVHVDKSVSTDSIIDILTAYAKNPFILNKPKKSNIDSRRVIEIDNEIYQAIKSFGPNRGMKVDYIVEAILSPSNSELFYGGLLFTKPLWKREVIVPVGRIDGLNIREKIIVELKFLNGWKSALGQILSYGYYYPTYTKYLYLLYSVNPTNSLRTNIIDISSCYNVNIKFIDTKSIHQMDS